MLNSSGWIHWSAIHRCKYLLKLDKSWKNWIKIPKWRLRTLWRVDVTLLTYQANLSLMVNSWSKFQVNLIWGYFFYSKLDISKFHFFRNGNLVPTAYISRWGSRYQPRLSRNLSHKNNNSEETPASHLMRWENID